MNKYFSERASECQLDTPVCQIQVLNILTHFFFNKIYDFANISAKNISMALISGSASIPRLEYSAQELQCKVECIVQCLNLVP